MRYILRYDIKDIIYSFSRRCPSHTKINEHKILNRKKISGKNLKIDQGPDSRMVTLSF